MYADAQTPDAAPAYSETAVAADSRTLSSASTYPQRTGSSFTADGKTSEQIIREAQERNEAKKSEKGGWKNSVKRAAEFAQMGAN